MSLTINPQNEEERKVGILAINRYRETIHDIKEDDKILKTKKFPLGTIVKIVVHDSIIGKIIGWNSTVNMYRVYIHGPKHRPVELMIAEEDLIKFDLGNFNDILNYDPYSLKHFCDISDEDVKGEEPKVFKHYKYDTPLPFHLGMVCKIKFDDDSYLYGRIIGINKNHADKYLFCTPKGVYQWIDPSEIKIVLIDEVEAYNKLEKIEEEAILKNKWYHKTIFLPEIIKSIPGEGGITIMKWEDIQSIKDYRNANSKLIGVQDTKKKIYKFTLLPDGKMYQGFIESSVNGGLTWTIEYFYQGPISLDDVFQNILSFYNSFKK